MPQLPQPAHPTAFIPGQEKLPTVRNWCTETREKPVQQQRSSTAKNKNKKNKIILKKEYLKLAEMATKMHSFF